MKYDEIRLAWNAQADDEKQWNSLTEAEKIEWASRLGAEKERGPAPTFCSSSKIKMADLLTNGFNIVGYALEHSSDNRRCTVDYTGLVRWVPSADQEVAVERAPRQKAQEEVVFLKEREVCAQVLEAALKVVSDALNDLVEACHGHDGKLKAPDKKELMRARSMLPPRCSYTLTKKI